MKMVGHVLRMDSGGIADKAMNRVAEHGKRKKGQHTLGEVFFADKKDLELEGKTCSREGCQRQEEVENTNRPMCFEYGRFRSRNVFYINPGSVLRLSR